MVRATHAASKRTDRAPRSTQIAQLQHDLAAAKLQATRYATDDAALRQSRSRAKEALQRTLDDAEASCRHLPPNGFADTMPSPQFPGLDMLLR